MKMLITYDSHEELTPEVQDFKGNATTWPLTASDLRFPNVSILYPLSSTASVFKTSSTNISIFYISLNKVHLACPGFVLKVQFNISKESHAPWQQI